MGTSNWQNISYCVDMIRRINPSSILDVGIGFGRWGIISREFLDVWNGRVKQESWVTIVEGIEAFPTNICDYHNEFYSKVWGVDARDFFRENKQKYDLIIFGDVLEHFYKNEGTELLNTALTQANYVMVNIPLGENWKQGSLYGNEFEEHKSEWIPKDFESLPVVRQRFFKDFIGRDFGSFLLSNQFILSNELLKLPQMDNELEQLKGEIDQITSYYSLLQRKRNEIDRTLHQMIYEGEMRIMNASGNEKSVIKIRVGGIPNKHSNGSEIWIYSISSDVVTAIDVKKIKMDNRWILREDKEAVLGKCLIASEIGSEIEFDIVGEVLQLKCLSHPWSGSIEIIKDDVTLLNVDLYSGSQKYVDIKINLKGEV